MTASFAAGLTCPAPALAADRVQLGHGSGGKMSALLLRERFLPHLGNDVLAPLADAAVLDVGTAQVALSTDTFVVSPLEFPGGNIGSLAVHGTLNDLAMMGATPRALSAGFVLEEGLPFDVLDRVVAAMARAARDAGVAIVTGDTKVVERGRADGMYVNTTGVGIVRPDFAPRPDAIRPGDRLLVSGPLGRHGMAIMAAREGLAFETAITSDSAALLPLTERLRAAAGPGVHAMRDATRGGLASAVNELAQASRVGVRLHEDQLVIPADVLAACEMLGLDALYVANEGVFVAFVAPEVSEAALAALRGHPLGAHARLLGEAVPDHPGLVVLRTRLGSSRVVDLLPGDQLPRIC